MNVESKLGKVLGKDSTRLVVKAAERDAVLNEISARMARYQDWDPDTYNELKALREDVKDIFNKGLPVGDEIMDQLYFLDPKTRELVDKMTRQYSDIVTPDDFKLVASIMSENLRSQVPILKDFTRFFGRLAEDFVINAKPSESFIDWKAVSKQQLIGTKSSYKLPRRLAEFLGINPNEPFTEKILKRFDWYKPDSTIADLMYGVKEAEFRRTGFKTGKIELADVIQVSKGVEVLYPNKLPKKWTQIPWVNFDGKIVEQKFTQSFEERLRYKDADGKWITNIIQVQQKTEPTWWEEIINKSNTINDIVDAQKARTAFAVNG